MDLEAPEVVAVQDLGAIVDMTYLCLLAMEHMVRMA